AERTGAARLLGRCAFPTRRSSDLPGFATLVPVLENRSSIFPARNSIAMISRIAIDAMMSAYSVIVWPSSRSRSSAIVVWTRTKEIGRASCRERDLHLVGDG